MQTSHESVADRIAHARGLGGLSPFKLSELAGLSKSAVWHIEHGLRPTPRVETLRRIAGVLGTTVGWLADGEGKTPVAAHVRAAVALAETRHDRKAA